MNMVFKKTQPSIENDPIFVDRNPLRARTEEEKALRKEFGRRKRSTV